MCSDRTNWQKSGKKRKNPPTPISAQFTLPKGFNKEDFKSIATKLQKLDTRSKTHQQNAFDNEEAIQAIADLAGISLGRDSERRSHYRAPIRLLLAAMEYEAGETKIEDFHSIIKEKFGTLSKENFHNIIAFRIVKTLRITTNVIIKILQKKILKAKPIIKNEKIPENKEIFKNEQINQYRDLLNHMFRKGQEFIKTGSSGSYEGSYRSINLEIDCDNKKIDFKKPQSTQQPASLSQHLSENQLLDDDLPPLIPPSDPILQTPAVLSTPPTLPQTPPRSLGVSNYSRNIYSIYNQTQSKLTIDSSNPASRPGSQG